MSDIQPSKTLGGMLAGLFRGKTNDDGERVGRSPARKALTGAVLAAGAAYLYSRYKNKQSAIAGS